MSEKEIELKWHLSRSNKVVVATILFEAMSCVYSYVYNLIRKVLLSRKNTLWEIFDINVLCPHQNVKKQNLRKFGLAFMNEVLIFIKEINIKRPYLDKDANFLEQFDFHLMFQIKITDIILNI